MYLESGEAANTDETARLVFNFVDRLFQKLPTPLIVILGDFNERRKDFENLVTPLRQYPMIPDGHQIQKLE